MKRIAKLHEHYQTEWYAYAGKALTAAFEKQNEMFRAHNPKLKRACYGPFNLYMSPLRTSKLSYHPIEILQKYRVTIPT